MNSLEIRTFWRSDLEWPSSTYTSPVDVLEHYVLEQTIQKSKQNKMAASLDRFLYHSLTGLSEPWVKIV